MNDLEQRVTYLEGVIKQLVASDRYTIQKSTQISDGRNIQVGKGTGTKIGTSALEKLAFHGATPIVQTTFIVAPIGGATTDGVARGIINNIRQLLIDNGLMAAS